MPKHLLEKESIEHSLIGSHSLIIYERGLLIVTVSWDLVRLE